MNVRFLFLSCVLSGTGMIFGNSSVIYPLKVHERGHFLVQSNGDPFFWMGDTAWRIFANLDREEVETYFSDRVQKGFNVIQCQILPINLDFENAYGYQAMEKKDPDRLVEEYWQHADYIIQKASDMGLYLAIVPALGKLLIESEKGIFYDKPDRAYRYGKLLGGRYGKMKNIIWVLGGDTWGTKDLVYNKLAQGIADGAANGDFDKVLMSFHPQGGTWRPPATSSGEFYHEMEWLDFNMIQSGHRIGNRNYLTINEDYKRTPVKPTLESEPCYEHHPVMHDYKNGDFDAWHMRRRAYWAILSGSFGYTYGAQGVWNMSTPERKGGKHNYFWYEALDFEGACDMAHVRKLFESRPCIDPERIPDQGIYVEGESESVDRTVRCARAADFSYWLLYLTNGKKVVLDLNRIENVDTVAAWWYNPRDGNCYDNNGQVSTEPFEVTRTDRIKDFNPPGKEEAENDWVLVLDNVEKDYGAPGT